jgi:predicted ATP-dependent endonuclease of OLD family
MKLTRIDITNDRLLFANNNDRVFSLDLLDGINAPIGPNNCGKSNVPNAGALTFDPAFSFDPWRDWPRASSGPGPG